MKRRTTCWFGTWTSLIKFFNFIFFSCSMWGNGELPGDLVPGPGDGGEARTHATRGPPGQGSGSPKPVGVFRIQTTSGFRIPGTSLSVSDPNQLLSFGFHLFKLLYFGNSFFFNFSNFLNGPYSPFSMLFLNLNNFHALEWSKVSVMFLISCCKLFGHLSFFSF